MPIFRVAHIRHCGQYMIIAPTDSQFGDLPLADQQQTVEALQTASAKAGLNGQVAVIWLSKNNVHYLAPSDWHYFFDSGGFWEWVQDNLNFDLAI